MKILFLVPYPTEGASNRIRVEQYMPYLNSKGVVCKIRPFVNSHFYKILYAPGRYMEKAFWFVICTLNRILDLMRAMSYDIIVIHREAYPFGGPIFETIFFKIGKPLVFDFDDAIFLPNTSHQNTYIERFKKPGKISKIIEMSALVIAGNDYLKDYALKYNKNVVVIPSSIDTDRYKPSVKRDKKEIIIGWIGSNTTKDFLYGVEEVFASLSNQHQNLIFKIIGPKFEMPMVGNISNQTWSLDSEIGDIQNFDIGIMPMPENEWTKGKCGFKALLYMSCGIPVVASPVGVNLKIIEEGVDGFFAKNNEEWLKKLNVLIENNALRAELGKKGRDKVLKQYSLVSNAPLFYKKLIEVYNNRAGLR